MIFMLLLLAVSIRLHARLILAISSCLISCKIFVNTGAMRSWHSCRLISPCYNVGPQCLQIRSLRYF